MYKRFIVSIVLLFVFVGVKAQYTKLLDFNGFANGSHPYGSLYYDGTYLYGVTDSGGVNGDGTIFKIKPDGTAYSKLIDFNDTNGSKPMGSLISDGIFLYGMTFSGGANSAGVIFRIKPDGTRDTVILNFSMSATNGGNPFGSLIYDGTFLYGTINFGGAGPPYANNWGLIFKVKPDGTGYTVLYYFDDIHGYEPVCSLVTDGTYLYGMTYIGGAQNRGVVYKIKKDGTGYTDLLDFNNTNGSNPQGSLIYDGSSYLYGVTGNGGASGKGVLFKVKNDGTKDTVLFNFSGTNGSYPDGSLIYDGTSYLYGMTGNGGATDSGTVFRLKTDGTGYLDLFDFGSVNGANPYGSLVSDGTYLYGMTMHGGANNLGVVFKYNYSTAGIKQLSENEEPVSIYPHPVCSSSTLSFNNQNRCKFFLDIYSNNGAMVSSSNTNIDSFTLQKQNFIAGIYFYHLYNAENNISIYNKIIFVN